MPGWDESREDDFARWTLWAVVAVALLVGAVVWSLVTIVEAAVG